MSHHPNPPVDPNRPPPWNHAPQWQQTPPPPPPYGADPNYYPVAPVDERHQATNPGRTVIITVAVAVSALMIIMAALTSILLMRPSF